MAGGSVPATAGPRRLAGSGSTRNIASTGMGSSLSFPGRCSVGHRSGARAMPVLANSSWAARSRAAAPSPNTRTDIDSTIAASTKRKPGSMERDFRLRS
jgi:hypothetical protein